MSAFRIKRATPRRFSIAFFTVLAAVGVLAGPGASVGLGAGSEAPVNTLAPKVVNNTNHEEEPTSAEPGQELFCDGGTWRGEPKLSYEWLANGAPIEARSELGASLRVTTAEEGDAISCNVIAKEGSLEEEEESSNSVAIPGGHKEPVPTNTTPPKVTPEGAASVESKLTCEPGTWTGSPTKYTYQWLSDSNTISGATEGTYKVPAAEEGDRLTCAVVASNVSGSSASKTSSDGVEVSVTKPADKTLPEVEGTVEAGYTLTCLHGEWSGEPTFAYQWLREGQAISGATGDTHVIGKEDQTHKLSCKVTATNAGGSTSKESAATKEVPGTPPHNVKPPVISGEPKVGETLTCSEGTWSGVPEVFTYKWQWLLNGAGISKSGTKATYVVLSEDRGKKLSCEVKAENGVAGSATAQSTPVTVPEEKQGSKPVNTKQPSVSGSASVGGELDCGTGEWNGNPAPTYTYQWIRKLGSEEAEVGSNATYRVKASDQGSTIWCVVTANNSEGTQKATSSNTVSIGGEAPVNEQRPVISPGAPEVQVGETLTCSEGEWSGAPTPTYTYAWLLNGSAIEGADSYSHTVIASDQGGNLTCTVTASNGVGSPTISESESVHVTGYRPYPVVAPSISGIAKAGETLTCEDGGWSGAPTPSYEYRWMLGASPILSATEQQYKVLRTDESYTLTCEVIARNSEGVDDANSEPVTVAGEPPVAVEAPQLRGTAIAGDKLECERGTWDAKPAPVFSFEWLLEGAPIAGATTSTYALPAADVDHAIACRVRATNPAGAGEATSAGVSVSAVTSKVARGPEESTIVKEGGEPSVSASQVLSRLSSELARLQHVVRIKALRKSHNYFFKFTAPAAGSLEYSWYEVPKGAHMSRKASKRKPVLVARATASFASASTKTVQLHLTSAGLRLIRSSRSIELTGKGIFTRSGQKPVSWLKSFLLSL